MKPQPVEPEVIYRDEYTPIRYEHKNNKPANKIQEEDIQTYSSKYAQNYRHPQ